MNQQILIKEVTIYTENNVIETGFILLSQGKIIEISEQPILQEPNESVKVIDGKGLIAIPGFIDTHIHGANGADMMDATEEALDIITKTLPQEGTTSFLATTMTQSTENIEKSLENVAHYINKSGYAEILGIHLEGPFIHKEKKGAQPEKYILEPNINKFKRWQQLAKGLIKTVTVAPECDNDALIPYLNENGIVISAGHTTATFEEIQKAVSQGLQQLTHLCNAMTELHHRDVGAVGAAFLIDSIKAELIADEIHTSKEMLQIIYNNIGSDRLFLITDAMRAKALQDGNYELGGQPVKVAEGRATLHNGTLAGSILRMDEAVKNIKKLTGVTLKDIIKMTAVNPAKQINIFDRKGSITLGKDADIVLVDQELTIKYTICRGVIAYKSEIVKG